MKKGFTLIEMVLAFAIIGMLMTGVTLSLTAVLRSTARSALQAKVRNEGEFLMETISQATRYSTQVQCGVDGSSQHYLTMAAKNVGDPTPLFTCLTSTGQIGSGSTLQVMNSSSVQIANCDFVCTKNGAANNTSPDTVEIVFSVAEASGVIAPLYYDTSVFLRNN